MRTVIICSDKTVNDEARRYLEKSDIILLGCFSTLSMGYDCIVFEHPDIVFLREYDDETLEYRRRIKILFQDILFICCSFHMRYLQSIDTQSVEYLLLALREDYPPDIVNIIRVFYKNENRSTEIPQIKCFGHFRINVKNREIKFATRKVRELLAFLLCQHGRLIYREDILRALFHSGDEKKDANNFRVTMHRLRESLAEVNIGNEYIMIDEFYSVQIPQGICDLVDLLDFIHVNKGVDENNIAEAQNIIDSIEGELFGDIDTPWVTDMREFVMIRIEELMLKTAQFYINTNVHMKTAEQILTRLIDINDLSERSYMMLLDLYIRCGEKMKYIYMYKRYARTLKIEFDSEPELRYTRYYNRLIK
jgi:two-component SAPR family response regulator